MNNNISEAKINELVELYNDFKNQFLCYDMDYLSGKSTLNPRINIQTINENCFVNDLTTKDGIRLVIKNLDNAMFENNDVFGLEAYHIKLKPNSFYKDLLDGKETKPLNVDDVEEVIPYGHKMMVHEYVN